MGRPTYHELRPYYKLEKKIGEGGFAKVRLATHLPTGEKVAIKIMEKVNLGKDLSRVLSEVEALKSLTHHHISQVYEVIDSEERIFIIMEYCSGGELFDYIVNNKRLSEAEARGFFRQVLSAVAFLHKKGYAHRDLKPENILLDCDHNLKLIDFGLCARPTGGISVCLSTACGSLNYAAPELLLGEKYLGSLADVWSLGVLLYALLCGALPFDDSGGMAGGLHRKIISGRYEEPEYLSKLSRDILRGMLQKDPRQRLSTEELLNHKWVTLECYDPVSYLPIYKHHERDDQILSLMSDYYNTSVQSAWHRLSTWTYDHFTASYLLLLNKKRRGLSFSFNVCTPLKRSRLKENRIRYSTENNELRRSPLSPSYPSYACMVENMQERCNSLELDGVVTRSRSSRKRGHNFAHENDASPFISTPIKKRRRTSDVNSENNTPTNSSSTPGKFLQSVEKRLNKMRNILTPKKRGDPDSPALLDAKDLHDVSVTSSCDPKKVLDDLTGALSSRSIICKSQGYVIRGKVFDNGISERKSTGCKLMFELEVCWVKSGQRSPVVGIRRKRLKGDTFYYKKICEQILQLTVK